MALASRGCDIVVVGAGVAGCMAAAAAARKAAGSLRVLLIDRNPPSEPGKKSSHGWICGDAIGEHHIKFAQERLGLQLDGSEVENTVDAIYTYSPDMETRIPFGGKGYILNRRRFALKLLEIALEGGAEFRPWIQITGLIEKQGAVCGVHGINLSDRSTFRAAAKVTIDTAGFSTPLRSGLTISSFMERRIEKDDIEPTIRMIGELAPGKEVPTDHCDIYLNKDLAPGGYLWIFPKSRTKVNIGLGIQQKQTSKSLQRLLDEWIARSPLLNGIRPLIENGNLPGTWPVSVRHQNDCLVANGFMIAGDSAWAANPISAGGMGPSIIGGILAGETAVEAVEQKDVSEAALWRYNLRYVNTYGRKTAALEAFRVYLQSLDNLEINYGMKYFLTPEQAESLLSSEVYDLSLLEKLVSAARAMTVTMHGHASLLRGLYFTHKRMQELNRLYEEYPEEPRKYPAWKKKVDSILSEVKRRFSH